MPPKKGKKKGTLPFIQMPGTTMLLTKWNSSTQKYRHFKSILSTSNRKPMASKQDRTNCARGCSISRRIWRMKRRS